MPSGEWNWRGRTPPGRLAAPALAIARRLVVLGLPLLALLLSGCVGPRGLELTRLRYDQAVSDTTEQQWLRNIVRLRYGEMPSMLDVAAITSQFELSGRGSYTGGRQRDSVNATNFGDLAVQFRDAPTLSYTPRDPAELTRAMVAPVGVTALGLMANTGWSTEDVLRLVVAEANGLENAPGAEQIVPADPPPFTPFPEVARLADLLRRERLAGMIAVDAPKVVSPGIAADRVGAADLVAAAHDKLAFRPTSRADALVLTRSESSYTLVFSPATRGQPEAESLRELLRLAPGRLEFPIRRADRLGDEELVPLPLSRDNLEVRTRTLLEMLTVLSKGVQIPDDHACRGLVAQAVGPDGVVFDWTQVTRGLFHVCVQRKRPKADEAAVAIEHRGYWFYIPAADKRSKSTLALLQTLFNLQLAEPSKAGPVLTLPVGF